MTYEEVMKENKNDEDQIRFHHRYFILLSDILNQCDLLLDEYDEVHNHICDYYSYGTSSHSLIKIGHLIEIFDENKFINFKYKLQNVIEKYLAKFNENEILYIDLEN